VCSAIATNAMAKGYYFKIMTGFVIENLIDELDRISWTGLEILDTLSTISNISVSLSGILQRQFKYLQRTCGFLRHKVRGLQICATAVSPF